MSVAEAGAPVGVGVLVGAQEFDDEGLVLRGDLGPSRVVAVDHEDQLVAGCLDLRQLGEPLLVLS